ncbi:MAG TPA: hypothetical protein PLD39_02695 [Flexilinea sp.]|nr:hypothetical protein [Flexilinea sp.]
MHKDKKAIKKDILDKFRTIRDEENYMLPPHWLQSHYIDTLDPQEKKIYEKAVKELVRIGLVESVEKPHQNLKLTEKGVNLIYYD